MDPLREMAIFLYMTSYMRVPATKLPLCGSLSRFIRAILAYEAALQALPEDVCVGCISK